ncbi:E3 ubiquitin-protein ligase UPL5 isoform X1 [Selaginella moellendorffii]|uniref:E3 ubiquitin-protein ligase UPL5 isoform X1 n=1 Tax=Selaginella moellendorffii TaxID=88036 RepID=UPI000D1CF740|nr:E3 ubiquitin-protein ligase UPL5 isoform X1 [Selaginella moellendorffii]|eukprot:XP_024543665.1 E3 ubiquitin-protein ligase UPL5 isoform X1 [Selaginella moellendorffii]
MVLTGLVQSLQRLFRNIRDATMVSCGPFRDPSMAAAPTSMEVSCSSDESSSRVAAAAAAAAAILTADRAQESFMAAARIPPPRNPSSKRKLEELDISSIEFSARLRREEPQDAESSGRQRRTDDQEGGAREDGGFLEESSSSSSSSKGFGKEGEGGDGGIDPGPSTDGDKAETVAMEVDRGVSCPSSSSHLQFFVKTYIDGKTIVLHATASDTIESVHQQILVRTGLPLLEQRLIFGGRQLQHDQSLETCHVTNDATLHLVARMRSTALPHSWQLINDLVATIRKMYGLSGDEVSRLGSKLTQCQDSVRTGVQEFLKMTSKSVPVLEHMQVFQLSGATSALVMLLLSPVESNRICAEESIKFFLTGNDDYLPVHLHCHSAPVLLDFCKLLSKSAPSHPLYRSCRSALARLLDGSDAAHGNPFFHEVKAETIVSDFSPFANELAESLLTRLQDYRSFPGQEFSSYIKEAKDFTAFITHICKSMAVCKVVDSEDPGNSSMDYLELRLGCSDETTQAQAQAQQVGTAGWLDSIFHRLLVELDKCLVTVLWQHEKFQEGGPRSTQGVEERPFARAPFLFVLKGLHAVAKLSDISSMKLLSLLRSQRLALNVLVSQSRWQDHDFWLLEYKRFLEFDSKKRLVMAMLPEPQDDHEERQEIVIQRSQLLTESLEQLVYVEAENIQGGLSVEFSSEEATGPGVLREWFFMVCKEIFNPQFALFLPCPNDRRRFYPNPASGVNPGHLTYFKFCGRVIALAMMHRVQVDVTFALFFFKQLAGLPITWEDSRDADPALYASCKNILEMDPDSIDSDTLGLTFVTEMELLGSRKVLELCPGGKDMAVTSTNRRHFVDLMVQRRLVAAVADQVKWFSQGFSDLLSNTSIHQFLRPLDLEDLDLMLYGKDREISVEDWKQHTEYHDYTASDEQARWFWEVVEEMSPERRRKLLFFATSVTHLPPEGFAGLTSKFHIHKSLTNVTWLPTAHTCFYQLILPPYSSFDVMHRSLYAITADHIAEGFGFA